MHFDCFTLFSVRRRLIASSQEMLERDFPSRPAVSRLICLWSKSLAFLKTYHCPNAAHEQLLCCWGSIIWETEAMPPLASSLPLLQAFYATTPHLCSPVLHRILLVISALCSPPPVIWPPCVAHSWSLDSWFPLIMFYGPTPHTWKPVLFGCGALCTH